MHVYGMLMVMVMACCRVVRMGMYVFFVYVDGYEYSYIGLIVRMYICMRYVGMRGRGMGCVGGVNGSRRVTICVLIDHAVYNCNTHGSTKHCSTFGIRLLKVIMIMILIFLCMAFMEIMQILTIFV